MRGKTHGFAPAVAALAWLAAGCGVVDSDEVETDEIWAYFTVDHRVDDSVRAWAELRRGGPLGYVLNLTSGDHVECNGVRLTEYEETVTDYHWSEAAVPMAVDGRYRFALVRTDGSASASLEMGAPPTILSTDPPDVMNYSDALTVRWDATQAATGVDIRVQGDCISEVLADNETDDGEHTFPRLTGMTGRDPCTITVRVIRAHSAWVRGGFGGGLIELNREAAATLVYEPL